MSIVLNEDADNFMVSNLPEKMSEDGLREQLDRYAAGGPKTLIFCGNCQRAMFGSRVFEHLWQGVEIRPDGRCFFRGREVTDTMKKNVLNCKRLNENVKDPFRTRIDYGRSLGMKIFVGMRMNDVHYINDPDTPFVSDFWREHQDCLIAPFSSEWWGRGFDYAKPEVCRRHLELVREYLTRFDSDGIELDWMRTPYYFKPGFEEENHSILTSFLRETRKMAEESAKRNGHPVSVIVRIPSRPDDARRMGFDVLTWVREKLVDRVVLTSYWGVTDFDIPLELWHSLLDPLNDSVKITAGLEIICGGTPFDTPFFNTKEIVFGYAASFYYRGSDDLYLFNHMVGNTGMLDHDGYREVLENAGNRAKTEAQERRHVVSYQDLHGRACGMPFDHILPLRVTSAATHLRINIGGAVPGRRAKIAAAFNGPVPTVRLNSTVCPPSAEVFGYAVPPNVSGVRLFDVPDGAAKNGDNVLSFISAAGEESSVIWCEIDLAPLK